MPGRFQRAFLPVRELLLPVLRDVFLPAQPQAFGWLRVLLPKAIKARCPFLRALSTHSLIAFLMWNLSRRIVSLPGGNHPGVAWTHGSHMSIAIASMARNCPGVRDL